MTQSYSYAVIAPVSIAQTRGEWLTTSQRKTTNMGTGAQAKKTGARSKNKQYKRKLWLNRRDKDIDQIQDEIELSKETGVPITNRLIPEFDDDQPGGGQFYCVETGKHFVDAKALADHKKTKFYKRRCKELEKEKYTQKTADWAAGKTKETLPPVHKVKDAEMKGET